MLQRPAAPPHATTLCFLLIWRQEVDTERYVDTEHINKAYRNNRFFPAKFPIFVTMVVFKFGFRSPQHLVIVREILCLFKPKHTVELGSAVRQSCELYSIHHNHLLATRFPLLTVECICMSLQSPQKCNCDCRLSWKEMQEIVLHHFIED